MSIQVGLKKQILPTLLFGMLYVEYMEHGNSLAELKISLSSHCFYIWICRDLDWRLNFLFGKKALLKDFIRTMSRGYSVVSRETRKFKVKN
jgi:hypothetical protein